MAFVFASLIGVACMGVVCAVFLLGRELAAWRWITSGGGMTAGPAGAAVAVLSLTGRAQETVPAIRRVSLRLHEKPARWLGAADPGSAVWLALKEACVIAGFLGAKFLLEDALLGLAAGAACFFLPDLVARDRHTRRQSQVRRELPDCLDLLALAVEAGMSLDAGLQQVADKLRGQILPDALQRMLGEVRFGVRRHQAWRDLGRRIGTPELIETMAALVQADTMGVGLGQALRGLSDQMRVRRRQRLEAMAHQAPVKMLFPLTLCIFPAVFIVLLGPVFLQLALTVNQ